MKIHITITAEIDSAQLPNYNVETVHPENLSTGLMKDMESGYLGFNDLVIKNFVAQKQV